MSNDADPHVVAIDRLHDGFFLYFNSGEQGFFPDTLLHSLLAHPQIMFRTPLLDFDNVPFAIPMPRIRRPAQSW